MKDNFDFYKYALKISIEKSKFSFSDKRFNS
jgi:hypothetical protein